MLVVYQANLDVLPTTDAIGNTHVALSLLNEGNVSFSPDEMPFMFRWLVSAGGAQHPIAIDRWSDRIEGVPASRLATAGMLEPDGGKYYIVRSRRTDSATGWPIYVNTSGPGPGLAAMPVMLLAQVVHGDLTDKPHVLWYAGKSIASHYVAASVALLFLIARRFVARGYAILIALAYGLGTCVWSLSSQALWQHGPAEFFLMLGIYWLSGDAGRWRTALLGGFSLALATLCRPTCGMLLVAVGIYFLLSDRRAAIRYSVGALPLLGMLAAYNWCYLGSPFSFGQTIAGHELALLKCGAVGSWQTPLWQGLAGNLISPSRGLFVYSPFLVFALAGAWIAWRRAEYRWLRPVSIGILLMLMVESKHYDWWGGWTFGYRHIVDLAPLLALLLVPVLPGLFRSRVAASAFALLLVWSIAVQTLGAFVYDGIGWNAPLVGYRLQPQDADEPILVETREQAIAETQQGARPLGEVRLDIDDPQHRHRLWSVRDNQIWYYATHLRESRAFRSHQSALARSHRG